jgi:arylsulfatase A-like enzyme
MSDNGISLGEHRYGQRKSCGYEECTRVPLVIVPPLGQEAAFGAPRLDHRLALNVDLAPTLADLAGVAPERPTDGLSLRPLLEDPKLAWDRAGLLELWAEEGDFPFAGLRYERWKYLRYVTGEQELYDLSADPYELDNLAAHPDQAAQLGDLAARLDAFPP